MSGALTQLAASSAEPSCVQQDAGSLCARVWDVTGVEWLSTNADALIRTPARVAGASVTFEPGARTAWHTHPLGQTLIVTAGSGLAQRAQPPLLGQERGGVVRLGQATRVASPASSRCSDGSMG